MNVVDGVWYINCEQAPAGGEQQVQQEPYFAAYDYNGQDQLQLTVSRGQKVLQQRHGT